MTECRLKNVGMSGQKWQKCNILDGEDERIRNFLIKRFEKLRNPEKSPSGNRNSVGSF